MFAPLPADPVFTVERRTVRAEVPLFLELCRFLSALFSTFLATLVGGGGGAGGGTGSGILGADVHIIVLLWVDYIFSLKLVVVLDEIYHGALSIVKVKLRNTVSCREVLCWKGTL
jgi:hypothetical protein